MGVLKSANKSGYSSYRKVAKRGYPSGHCSVYRKGGEICGARGNGGRTSFTLSVKEGAPHHDDEDGDGTNVHIFLCPAPVAGQLYVKEEQLPGIKKDL